MDVREVGSDGGGEWESLLSMDRHSDFLQTRYWARMLEESYGFQPHYLEFSEAGEPAGCIALYDHYAHRRDGGAGARISNSIGKAFGRGAIAYGGPALRRPESAGAVVAELLDWLENHRKKNNARGVKLTLFKYNWKQVDAAAIEAMMASRGYAKSLWATYLVDIRQDENSLIEYIGKSARKSLRKARDDGIVVAKVRDHDDYVENFIKPYIRMEMEHGRDAVQASLVEKTKSLGYLNKQYHYYRAEKDGTTHGVIGMCTFNGWAAEVMSATSAFARENQLYVQDVLHWRMFADARALGCHTFDMAGVNPNPSTPKEHGINQFKKKWGGEYVEYPIFERRVGGLASRATSAARRAMGRVRGAES